MNKKVPNFFQMEIKNFTVGSFYTGFSSENFVGQPDYAITVLFSNEEFNKEGLPLDFEGRVRRIAHEILTKKDDPNFNIILKEYYIKLENGELEPYWNESKSTDTRKLGESLTISKIKGIEIKNNPIPEEISSDEKYYKLENEVLKGEIESLELIVKEKNEKIKELTDNLTIVSSEQSEAGDWKAKFEKLEEINKKLNEDIRKLTKDGSKHSERADKQDEEIIDLKNKIITKDTLIEELNRKVENLSKKVEELKKIDEESIENLMKIDTLKDENKSIKQQLEKVNRENEIHLDSIAKFKLEIRDLKEKLSSNQESQYNVNETIIDLKKEIKVLRRERDHYKDIIKEKKLL
jgi:chromosome segregation ATPase